jgi:Tol biopolymer transport system component/tRNA A-37 threonylcarbamoyl transferase component Bud32
MRHAACPVDGDPLRYTFGMPLHAGARLGAYEILAPLGAGGMGEVYRARDVRLKREAALKLLPERLARDPQAMERFRREAQLLAGLHHPHIAAVYGFEGSALAMELVEGETLAERLRRGPLPVEEALAFAQQLAAALEYAHERGIIHRDLKPANIKLTSDDQLKVLDFGLAKALEGERAASSAAELADSPTLSAAVTQEGVILGTAAYMAPEQARGKAVDRRADIWAFGAVLYEMLTGRQAFAGESTSDILAAVLRTEPDLGLLPAATPGALRRLVERCLRKDPRQRLQAIGDARIALEEMAAGGAEPPAAMAAAPRRRRLWRPIALAAGAALLGAGLAARVTLAPHTRVLSESPMVPLALDTDAASGATNNIFWSPDGSALAFPAPPAPGAEPQLFLYRQGGAVPEQLTHLAVGVNPIGWSADSRTVYFIADRLGAATVWSIAAVGGAPQPVLDFHHPAGGVEAVTADGQALAALLPQPDGQLGVAYSRPLGAALRWYRPAPFAVTALNDYPSLLFSPDGRQLLLSLPDAQGPTRTWLLPFPPKAAQRPRPVLANLPPHDWSPSFSWFSDSRHLMVTLFRQAAGASLWRANPATGAFHLLATDIHPLYAAALAPGLGRLAVARIATDLDVISVDIHTGAITPLENSHYDESMPAWAQDAPDLVYVTNRDGAGEIWLRRQTREGVTERPVVTQATIGAHGQFQLPALSPRGRRIAYTLLPTGAGAQPMRDLLWIASAGGGAPMPLTTPSRAYQVAPAWSPDGTRIAYLSGGGADFSLAVAATSGSATPRILKAQAGRGVLSDQTGPAWSPDGKWIAFEATDGLVHLITPDGTGERVACATPLLAWTFSAGSRQLLAIARHGGDAELVSVALAGGPTHVLADLGGNLPTTFFQPGYHLSLEPGGRSVTYATGKYDLELDLTAPFSAGGSGWARLRQFLRLP